MHDLIGLVARISLNGETAALPLLAVKVEADIQDFVAEVNIFQVYKNTLSQAAQATYYFPVDVHASVCKFSAEYSDGTVVDGLLRDRAVAKVEFQQAITAGYQAQLMEAVRPDIFSITVGRLPSKEEIQIRLTYICALSNEGDAARFFLPTHIGARYSPPGSLPLLAGTTWEDMGGVSIRARFRMRSNIKSVHSPTHGGNASWAVIQDPLQPREITTSLTDIELLSEVVILCEEVEAHQPRTMLEVDEDGSIAGVVTLFPHMEFRDVAREFVFIVDRSGSMAEVLHCAKQSPLPPRTKVDHAKEALSLFLRALPPSSHFNVIGFGSSFTPLFETSRAYDAASLEIATQYVQSIAADFGGTEILAPLQYALKGKDRKRQDSSVRAMERQIVVLTDGQVFNEADIFRAIRTKREKAQGKGRISRVFTLGIGGGVSHHLVEGMARAGGGTAEFVTADSDDLAMTTLRQLKLALQPALQDVTVTWNLPSQKDASSLATGEGKVEACSKPEASRNQASALNANRGLNHYPLFLPTQAPPVFNQSRFLSYVLFPPSHLELPETVTVRAQSPDGPLQVTLPIADHCIVRGNTIHRLAARTAIREFEDRSAGGRDSVVSEDGVSQQLALSLALKYQLVSKQTSFVVVRRTGSATGPKQVIVPLPVGGGADSNPIGRLLGPRGKNLKKLQADFGVSIRVEDGVREAEWGGLIQEPCAVITGEDHGGVDAAAEKIRERFCHAGDEDDEQRAKLVQLSRINGTLGGEVGVAAGVAFEMVDQDPAAATHRSAVRNCVSFLTKKSWHATPSTMVQSETRRSAASRWDAMVDVAGQASAAAAAPKFRSAGLHTFLFEGSQHGGETNQQDWIIPPCVSSWKNAKGYSLPLPSQRNDQVRPRNSGLGVKSYTYDPNSPFLICDPRTSSMRAASRSRSGSPSRGAERSSRSRSRSRSRSPPRSRREGQERRSSRPDPAAFRGTERKSAEESGRDDHAVQIEAGEPASFELSKRWDRDMVVQLLLQQEASGTFSVVGVSRLMKMTPISVQDTIKTRLPQCVRSLDAEEAVTVLALALMRGPGGEWRGMWELQEGKAMQALASSGFDSATVDRLVAALSEPCQI